MYEELEMELNILKDDITDGSLVFGRYFDFNDYEDEYGHNEIEYWQGKFNEIVKEYIKNTAPNKYIVGCSDYVFVMTIEEAKRRKILHIEDLVVM